MWRLDELIVKGAVAAGSTSDSSWAGPLAPQQTLAGEFVEYLRPATIIGRIPGLRNVPFNVKFGEVTADVSAAFVGQGIAQLVIITPLTLELAQDSSPHAAATIAADCRAALAAGLDEALVDPDRVAVTDTSAFRRAQR